MSKQVIAERDKKWKRAFLQNDFSYSPALGLVCFVFKYFFVHKNFLFGHHCNEKARRDNKWRLIASCFTLRALM
jgi:hypothetical protein